MREGISQNQPLESLNLIRYRINVIRYIRRKSVVWSDREGYCGLAGRRILGGMQRRRKLPRWEYACFNSETSFHVTVWTGELTDENFSFISLRTCNERPAIAHQFQLKAPQYQRESASRFTFAGRIKYAGNSPSRWHETGGADQPHDPAAGTRTKSGNHSFRATCITAHLKNGGRLAVAQQPANHESSHTTGLYDRHGDEITLDEVKRAGI